MFLKLRAHIASLLCWNAGPQGSWRHDRPFKHHGSGCNYRMLSDDRTIQHDRIHPNQCTGLNVGPVNRRIVANAGTFIDAGFAFVERAMDDGAVLDVHPRPNSDGRDIAANDAIEPA